MRDIAVGAAALVPPFRRDRTLLPPISLPKCGEMLADPTCDGECGLRVLSLNPHPLAFAGTFCCQGERVGRHSAILFFSRKRERAKGHGTAHDQSVPEEKICQ
jgi:hypothetical protein